MSFGDGNTAGSLKTTPNAARGFGIRPYIFFLPSPPNYVTRSPEYDLFHVSFRSSLE